jgi:hypothetical protein
MAIERIDEIDRSPYRGLDLGHPDGGQFNLSPGEGILRSLGDLGEIVFCRDDPYRRKKTSRNEVYPVFVESR